MLVVLGLLLDINNNLYIAWLKYNGTTNSNVWTYDDLYYPLSMTNIYGVYITSECNVSWFSSDGGMAAKTLTMGQYYPISSTQFRIQKMYNRNIIVFGN